MKWRLATIAAFLALVPTASYADLVITKESRIQTATLYYKQCDTAMEVGDWQTAIANCGQSSQEWGMLVREDGILEDERDVYRQNEVRDLLTAAIANKRADNQDEARTQIRAAEHITASIKDNHKRVFFLKEIARRTKQIG